MALSVYIENSSAAAGYQYFNLKVEDIAVQIARTPLQMTPLVLTVVVPQ